MDSCRIWGWTRRGRHRTIVTGMLVEREILRRRGVWVFDLDHTLYPAPTRLGPQLTDRVGRFVWSALELDMVAARMLKHDPTGASSSRVKRFIARHGATMQRLLADGHSIDYSALRARPRLSSALARLPGRKVVFTNASARHAEAVLDRLGLDKAFDAVFDAAAAGYLPKPEPIAYGLMIARLGIDPRDAVMVEDLARNLAPAASLGMTTVWARPRHQPRTAVDVSHIDYVTDDLVGWLEDIASVPRFGVMPARRAMVDRLRSARHVRA